MNTARWTPPFCANEAPELTCPVCGENEVRVREKEIYFEGDVEAYCGGCRADLTVQANVDITFSDVQREVGNG